MYCCPESAHGAGAYGDLVDGFSARTFFRHPPGGSWFQSHCRLPGGPVLTRRFLEGEMERMKGAAAGRLGEREGSPNDQGYDFAGVISGPPSDRFSGIGVGIYCLSACPNTLDKERATCWRSGGARAPSFRRTKRASRVNIFGRTTEACGRPAFRHSLSETSLRQDERFALVIIARITFPESFQKALFERTRAGRRFELLRSVKGKGTTTRSKGL